MRISHKHRFIFISKPRCASTTVREILNPLSDIISKNVPPFHHHATALELKTFFKETGWLWSEYYVFTTVRNPWDMMVSYYEKFQPDINGIYNYEKERFGIKYHPNNLISFEDWILKGHTYHRLKVENRALIKNVWTKGFSKLTLANTINDEKNKSLVNRIIKTEDLESGLNDVFNEIGLREKPDGLKRLNSTTRKYYRSYYNDLTREKIEKEFVSDIKYGSYTF